MKPRKNNVIPYHSDQELILPADTSQSFAISARDWEVLQDKVSSLSSSASKWELAFSVSFSVFLSFLISALATLSPQEIKTENHDVVNVLNVCYWLVTAFSLGVTGVTFVAMKQQKSTFNSNKEDLVKAMSDIYGMYVKDESGEASFGYMMNSTYNKLKKDDITSTNDELYATAKEIALNSGKVSTSFLQRRLRIGYARAARIVEAMEMEGFVGPADGAKPRPVNKDK